MTKQDLEYISDAAQKIRLINITEFLERVRLKLEEWKGRLNG